MDDKNDKAMQDAIAECLVYNRMGGLDESVIADIAHDHGVDEKELSDNWNK